MQMFKYNLASFTSIVTMRNPALAKISYHDIIFCGFYLVKNYPSKT